MKTRSLFIVQPKTSPSPTILTLKFSLLFGFAIVNAACSSADPLKNPPASAAELEVTSENSVSPVVTTDGDLSSTPSQIDNAENEPLGAVLPLLPVNEIEPTTSLPEENAVNCTATESDMQQRMLQLINEARAIDRICGTKRFFATREVSWNTTLASAARGHSDDMATHNFFSHTGSDGSSASSRVTAERYQWSSVGENIAAGRNTATETMNDWLASSGHCSNIMNPSFSEVAVACVEDDNSDYGRYWTNVLATQR